MPDLYGIPTSLLTFGDVRRFCAEQIKEHVRLEYKQEYPGGGWKIAKEVAAFANTQGGTLIIGARESEERTPSNDAYGMPLGDGCRDSVVSACNNGIFPPVSFEVSEFLRNPEDKEVGFIVVRVHASDQIHSVEGGRGVYLRLLDQSTPARYIPTPPTVDEFEFLTIRRRKVIDTQRKRRERALSQLHDALAGGDSHAPLVAVSIGPYVGDTPICNMEYLRDSVRGHVDGSYRAGNLYPPFTGAVRGIADGVYTLDQESGSLADIYGNITLAANRTNLGLFDRVDESQLDIGRVRRHGEDAIGVPVEVIIERLARAIEVSDSLYRHAGFYGLSSVEVNCLNVRGVVLSVPMRFGLSALGNCPYDDGISAREIWPTTSLHVGNEWLLTVVKRVIWSWGCTDERLISAAMDEGWRSYFGENDCPCGRGYVKPEIRSECILCRPYLQDAPPADRQVVMD